MSLFSLCHLSTMALTTDTVIIGDTLNPELSRVKQYRLLLNITVDTAIVSHPLSAGDCLNFSAQTSEFLVNASINLLVSIQSSTGRTLFLLR